MPNQPRILYSFVLTEATVTMSLFLHPSVPLHSFTRLLTTARACFSHKTSGCESHSPRTVQCIVAKRNSDNSSIIRRTANYQPPIWDYDYMQSLKSEYVVYILFFLLFLLLVLRSRGINLVSFFLFFLN